MILKIRKTLKNLSCDIRQLFTRFGYYGSKGEYYVKRTEVRIPYEFRRHPIGRKKWERKLAYWKEHGEFESKIIVHRRDWMLLDGYSSYRIAEEYDIEKIPVYFVD